MRGRRVVLFGILAASMFPPIIVAHTVVGWLYALVLEDFEASRKRRRATRRRR